MKLNELFENRRSIRGFKPDVISRDTLEDILRLASRSASFTNTQPWEVAVVTGKTRDVLSQRLREAAIDQPGHSDMPYPKSWPQAHSDRARTHNMRRFEVLNIAREDKAGREALRLSNFEFFGAPCALFIFMDKTLSNWSLMDIGQFLQGIALAAVGHGLGTCFQASLSNYPEIVRDTLGISDDKQLLVGMSIGYPDSDAPLNAYHSTRESVDSFTQWFD